MTAFGWKRKIGQISSNQALGAFSESNQVIIIVTLYLKPNKASINYGFI